MDQIDYNDHTIKEIVEDFDKRHSCALWFWSTSADGSFGLYSRKEMLELYIHLRDGGRADQEMQQWRTANTFTEAKENIIADLSYCSNALKRAVRQAKEIKKGSRK